MQLKTEGLEAVRTGTSVLFAAGDDLYSPLAASILNPCQEVLFTVQTLTG